MIIFIGRIFILAVIIVALFSYHQIHLKNLKLVIKLRVLLFQLRVSFLKLVDLCSIFGVGCADFSKFILKLIYLLILIFKFRQIFLFDLLTDMFIMWIFIVWFVISIRFLLSELIKLSIHIKHLVLQVQVILCHFTVITL